MYFFPLRKENRQSWRLQRHADTDLTALCQEATVVIETRHAILYWEHSWNRPFSSNFHLPKVHHVWPKSSGRTSVFLKQRKFAFPMMFWILLGRVYYWTGMAVFHIPVFNLLSRCVSCFPKSSKSDDNVYKRITDSARITHCKHNKAASSIKTGPDIWLFFFLTGQFGLMAPR